MMSENHSELCHYLERISRLNLPMWFKNKVIDLFLGIKTTDDLYCLCRSVESWLIKHYGYNAYFVL